MTNDQPTITAEQVAAYQRHLAAQEQQPTELDRLIALAKMTRQERARRCSEAVAAIYAAWHCEPVVLSQVVNGAIVVVPGIDALPIQLPTGVK